MARHGSKTQGKRPAVNPVAAQLRQVFEQGLELHRKGQLAAAGELYEKVLRISPTHFDALNNLGLIRKQAGRLAEALELIERAIRASPGRHEAHNNRGNILRELGEVDAALASYEHAIALKADYAEGQHNRGIVLRLRRQYAEALQCHDRALAIRPAYAEAWCERGNALKGLGRFAAALESYAQAIALRPDYADAHNNSGVVLKHLGRFDESRQAYARAIAVRPDYTDAHWNRSLLDLLCGNFRDGWAGYEWRWKEGGHCWSERRSFSQPLWLGRESLHGRSILLWAEQGLGDTLQFCRYASRVAGLGARVILEVQRPLVGLLQQLDGVATVLARGEPLPDFDFQCPLLSLPLACGTELGSIPSPGPYLRADPARLTAWAERLGAKTRPRIGIVWSGSSIHANDANRSIRLADFIGLKTPALQFVSLQKEVREADQAVLAAHPEVLQFAQQIDDFGDTAALCELMDCVVAVDTSVAHLAAALGREVRVLLPETPDWRWLLDRDDSPWYARTRLYRQQTAGDWGGVIERLRGDLAALA